MDGLTAREWGWAMLALAVYAVPLYKAAKWYRTRPTKPEYE